MTRQILLFLLLLSLCSCIKEEIPPSFALQEGETLPVFTISNETETIRTTDLKNKITIILFFNTTCPDCQRAFPAIQSLYEQYGTQPEVCIIAIARDQTENEVTGYFKLYGYTFPFFTDPVRQVYTLFASQTIPRLFLAGKNGKIVKTQQGKIDLEEINALLTQLFTEEKYRSASHTLP